MSNFRPHIDALILNVTNLGFSLQYLKDNLDDFDSYCDKNQIKDRTLTKSLSEKWIYSYRTHSKQQLDIRIRTMKYLGRYLNSVGILSYVPDYRIKSDPSAPPTLLKDDELFDIFKALDTLSYDTRNPNRIYTYPVMFRLIYSCGLRTSEACNLKMDEIDLETGKITIIHSKGNKDREIYMSTNMLELCTRFNAFYSAHLPSRTYFFQCGNEKTHYKNTDMNSAFNSALRITGIDKKYPRKPTPHGLRHLFAVKSMKKCLDLGYDFNNWIKYLSQYMGHSSPQETMYYLHMVSALIPEYKEKMAALDTGMEVLREEF